MAHQLLSIWTMKNWILCAWFVTGCFSSTEPPPGCPSPCRAGTAAVDFCDIRNLNCTVETNCNGEPQFCTSPACDEPVPECPRGEAVTSCEGFEDCFELEVCELTLYCAEQITCDRVPSCNRDERLSDVPCSGEPTCSAGRTCDGRDFYCYGLGDVCAAETPPCPAGTVEVDFCNRDAGEGCTVVEGCSEDRFCLADSCLRAVPPRRPGCEAGTEPSTIPCTDEERRTGVCESVPSVCGQPLYCRSSTMCEDLFPDASCGPGESASSMPCGPIETCREVRGACGETIYCRAGCTELPERLCAASEQWSADPCMPGEVCRPAVSPMCGANGYCRPIGCVGAEPTCDEGEESSISDACRPGEESCRELVGVCGGHIYCRRLDVCDVAPCGSATSEVLSEAPNASICNSIESCFAEELPPCAGGGTLYCIQACPTGTRQLGDRLDCPSAQDCFLNDPNSPLIDDAPFESYWCTYDGMGPLCYAIPTCDEGDAQIPWETDCSAADGCYTRSACGASVLCRRAP